MSHSVLKEILQHVKAFTDDMDKIGVRVVVKDISIDLDVQTTKEESANEGGDPADKKEADTQR